MTSPVRRSTRERKKASSFIDEASKKVEEERQKKKELKRVNEDSSEDEAVSSDDDEPKKTTARKSSAKKKNKAKNDGEDTEMKNVDSDLGEEMDEQDEEEDDRPRSAKKQKKSNGNKKSAAARKSTAKKGGADARRSTAKKAVATGAAVIAAAGGGGAGKITKARIASALNMLAKKILDQRVETPDKSVFAALLASTKPIPQIPSTTNPKQDTSSFRSRSISPVVTKIVSLTKSLSIPQLDGVARHLVQNFESNGMHIQLMNLLFRSVGGSLETDIKEGTDLEELEDEQWDDIMDKVVTAMQEETDADQVLLCADHPPAPPHETSQKIGLIAYRAIFKEFWYRLGHVLLAHAPSSSTRANDLMDDQEESDSDDDSIDSFDFDGDKKDEKTKDKTKKIIKTKATRKGASAAPVQEAFTSNSFQLEMMRDLISRITEFVTIGQPDLRSSGTLAIFQLGKACVERSVELESKIQIATRQFKAAKQSQSHAKMEAIRNKMDAWKRHKAELEEIVTGQVIQAAFIHRYRDANTTIRQECMDALSELSLIRPDIFLVDTYLKYFGWMTHDKKAVVRKAALSALLAPFEAHLEHVKTASSSRSSTMSSSPCRIDIAAMQHVTLKFLGRFVDCADDSEDVGVQELALKLLVAMINADFLDEVEDDNIWDSVNMKCLDVDSTPEVRKDALYFVLEQLDSFDDLEAQPLGEKKLLERFASLAGWLANLLADGHIPVDKIRIERIDYIVESLLQMPEHKDIVLNWRVMVQAIRNTNPNQQGSTEKEELTKQRVMLRMLVTSAKIFQKQIESSDKDARAGTKRRRSDQNEKDRTELSVALLQNLPSLFKNYQGDRIALRDVSGLAQLVQSSVLGLPSRKPDFQNVLKSLCQLYLDSSDEVTLQNVAATLSRWVEGDHTRVSEVKMQLKRLSRSLQDRLMDRFRESDPESTTGGRKSPRAAKKKQRTDHSQSSSLEIFSTSPEVDLEHSIALLLFRWKVLLEGCNTKYLFDEPEENEEHEMEGLFNTIAEAMGKRLKDREPTPEEKSAHDDRTIATISSIWKDGDPNVHEEVAKSVDLALRVLLLIIASELADTLERRAESENLGENDMDFDSQEFPVFKHRDAFVKLLIICFEQFLEKDAACSDDQYTFAGKIQASAGKVLSDLRSLFSPDFSEASDPLLRALALQGGQDVAMLLGGFARWFQSRDSATETADDEIKWMEETVLPLCRAICNNMKDFFRREMALVLTHMHGSGNLSNKTVLELIKKLRKENPVRVLESHMACLRMAFLHWLESEPEEPEHSAPTEEECAAYDEEEKRHLALFTDMEHLSQKLSNSLGVGRLGKDYKRSFLSFMKEGVRFAFEEDETYTLGVRLSFLSILLKYSNWIKKEEDDLEELTDFLLSKESELRSHSDFSEVHEDDVISLAKFKESLGIKRTAESSYYDEETTIATRTTIATPSPSSSLNKTPAGSSRRSVQSNISNLSPLEEGDSQDEEASPTPQKRRRLMSTQSSMTTTVVMEEEEQASDSDDTEA